MAQTPGAANNSTSSGAQSFGKFFRETAAPSPSSTIQAARGTSAARAFTPDQLRAVAESEGLSATQQQVFDALIGQESGYGANSSTSTDGARGAGQVMPGTFRQYAKAGESIDNPDHNLRVAARIVRDLGQKSGDDPGRMATGYFSGPGNMARGGANPWIEDRADGNGKKVSAYVTDVLGRLTGSKPAQAAEQQQSGVDLSGVPKWTSVVAKDEYRGMSAEDRAGARAAYFDAFIAPTVPADQRDRYRAWFDEQAGKVEPAEPTSVLRRAGDYGVSAMKGVVGVPQALTGLADIVTGGRAGKAMESAGVRFKDTQDILDNLYSPAQQEANRKVAEAKGFTGTAGAMIENPSTIGQAVVESAPSMLGGAAVGRGILAAAPKVGAALAAAAGEGVVGAGQSAETIRQQSADGLLSAKQAGAALASGAGTAAFGAAGGRLAQKLGIADIDTALVRMGATAGSSKNAIRRMVEGGISEGVLEELPQSVQEQVWQNAALDKPLLDGVPEAAAQGLITGAAMGAAGGGALTHRGPAPEAGPDTAPPAPTERVEPTMGDAPAAAEPAAAAAAEPAADADVDRDVLDYAATRYRQLRTKRDGEIGEDGMDLPGAGLSDAEQEELAGLEANRGNARALAQQYGFDLEAPTAEAVAAAANEAATSPANDLPQPTDAQKEAGNYKVGRVKLHGLDIAIENPAGSTRSGVDPNGKAWENTLQNHYGYVRGTKGADGDAVDVFVGPAPQSARVYVVDQIDPDTGRFDEVKALMGFTNQQEAEDAYHANYAQGWNGMGHVTEVPVDGFKAWLNKGDTSKPFGTVDFMPAEGAAPSVPDTKVARRQALDDYSAAVEAGDETAADEAMAAMKRARESAEAATASAATFAEKEIEKASSAVQQAAAVKEVKNAPADKAKDVAKPRNRPAGGTGRADGKRPAADGRTAGRGQGTAAAPRGKSAADLPADGAAADEKHALKKNVPTSKFIEIDDDLDPESRAWKINTVDAVREAVELIGEEQLQKLVDARPASVRGRMGEGIESALSLEKVARKVVDFNDRKKADALATPEQQALIAEAVQKKIITPGTLRAERYRAGIMDAADGKAPQQAERSYVEGHTWASKKTAKAETKKAAPAAEKKAPAKPKKPLAAQRPAASDLPELNNIERDMSSQLVIPGESTDWALEPLQNAWYGDEDSILDGDGRLTVQAFDAEQNMTDEEFDAKEASWQGQIQVPLNPADTRKVLKRINAIEWSNGDTGRADGDGLLLVDRQGDDFDTVRLNLKRPLFVERDALPENIESDGDLRALRDQGYDAIVSLQYGSLLLLDPKAVAKTGNVIDADAALISNDPLQLNDIAREQTVQVKGERRPVKDSTGRLVAEDMNKQLAFYRWFGDSKVVDADGKPLVVYHGTARDFAEFKVGTGGKGGRADTKGAIFATNSPQQAEFFAKMEARRSGDGPSLMPIYIRIENPLTYDYDGRQKDGEFSAGLIEQARSEGRDGVILRNVRDAMNAPAADVFIAFDPTQIKSATGNSGTFNPDDANIVNDIDLSQDGPLSRQPEQKRINALAKLRRLQKRLADGKITDAEFAGMVQQLTSDLEQQANQRSDARLEKETRPRERGELWIRERLLRAKRTGELDAAQVDLALWALDQNPALANDLGISLRDSKNDGIAGSYIPGSRIINLIRGNGNTETVLHEIMHHTERMMPPEVQQGIVKEWARAMSKAWKAGNEQVRDGLMAMMESSMGDKAAHARMMQAFRDGVLKYDEHYHLVNASEFWAVNATNLLARRAEGSRSWIARAKTWLAEFVERIRGLLGLPSSAPVLAGLRNIMAGKGERLSDAMLVQLGNGKASAVAEQLNNIDPPDSSAWTAHPTGKISPITRMPVFQIKDKDGQLVHTMHSAPDADTAISMTAKIMEMRAQRATEAPAVRITEAPKSQAQEQEQRSGWKIYRDKVNTLEGSDDYYYHVTSHQNARQIIRNGLIPGSARMFGRSYEGHSAGRVFLTDRDGVNFWKERVEQSLFHSFDSPPAVAVVRIPKTLVKNVQVDQPGTVDSRANAYYVEGETVDGKAIPADDDALFDITRPRTAAQKAQQQLVDEFGKPSFGTIDWWDKSVGTQYHKAAKNPKFKKVFDLSVARENAVSLTAMRPAEKALGYLPRIDDFKGAVRTLLQGRKTGTQTDLAGRALLEGTLAGDSVVEGRVWTAAELRAKGLDDQGIALYKQARAAIDASLDETAAAEAYSIAHSFIPKSLRDQVLDEPVKARKLIGDALEKRIKMEDDAVRALNAKRAKPEVVDAAKERLRQSFEVKDKLGELFEHVDKLQAAGYTPLMRFGKYFVQVEQVDPDTGKTVIDPDTGKPTTLFFGRFETEAEANDAYFRQQVAHRGKPEVKVTSGTVNDEQHKLFQGISPETIELFGQVVGAGQATERFYQAALSERSALKRRLTRNETEGYSDNMPRVLANFITSNARYASGRYYNRDINQAIKYIPRTEGDVQKEAIRLKEYIDDPGNAGAIASALAFTWFLGGNVASAVVNATQPFMMTAPYLRQYVTGPQAYKAMAAAAPYALGKKQITDAGLRAALKRGGQEGKVDAQEIFHLYSIGIQNIASTLAGKLSKLPVVGKKVKGAQESASARINALGTLWGMPFAMVEGFNRRLTFIAAWDVAKQTGEPDPYQFAVDAIDQTQGIYNKVNRPNWARSSIGRVLFTFAQFKIMNVELIKRMATRGGPEGKKAAAMYLATLILAAGASGIPYADDLDDLIDTVGQWLGYNTNMKRTKREWAYKTLGDGFGDLALYGVSSHLPFDLGGRMGLGNILPATGIAKPSGEGNRGQDLMELAGPALGGLGGQFGEAFGAAGAGDYGAALAGAMPTAVKNALAGADMMATGKAKDRTGKLKTEVTPVDAASKAIGFNPSKIANKNRANMPIQQDLNLQRLVEGKVLDQWAQGIAQNDGASVKAAQERMANWNRKNPETPISISANQLKAKVKILMTSADQRLLKKAPKEMKARVVGGLADMD